MSLGVQKLGYIRERTLPQIWKVASVADESVRSRGLVTPCVDVDLLSRDVLQLADTSFQATSAILLNHYIQGGRFVVEYR